MRIPQVFLALGAATLLMTGCSSQKDPATQSVAQGEAALAEVREDAARYAPEELKAPEATLAKFKEDLAKEDYKAVMDNVPKFNAEMKTLKEVVVSKQTQAAAATNEWTALNTEVPKVVQEIQARVDTLSKGKLPKEVTKENFDTAKTEFETVKTQWAEATAAFQAGDALAAADKGRQVKAKAEELKGKLGMNPA
jgi:hypothetical protein